jgi:TonB family protein
MRVHRLIIAGTLLAAVPVVATAADEQAARNAANWDVFQKLYPPRALAAKEEGAVGFIVTLDSKGEVTDCRVTHSSGHPLLDEETCKLVTLNAQFKPDPTLGPSQTKSSQGVIAWKLPNSTTVLSAPTRVAQNAAPEKIVCKKVPRTGSLAGFERTCMTPTDWNRQRDAMKEPYEDLQGKKGSTSGN